MKRICLAALITALAVAGCSKPDTFRKEDQYVCRTGPFVVSVFFTGSVTVYQDGTYVLQSHQAGVEGSYPELRIGGAGLYLDCRFSDPSGFTADVILDGGLPLPKTLAFKRDATILDANGDGRLD